MSNLNEAQWDIRECFTALKEARGRLFQRSPGERYAVRQGLLHWAENERLPRAMRQRCTEVYEAGLIAEFGSIEAGEERFLSQQAASLAAGHDPKRRRAWLRSLSAEAQSQATA